MSPLPTLNQLYKERPSLRHALSHCLNSYDKSYQKRQDLLWTQIHDIEENKGSPIYLIEDLEIILISIDETLKWIGKNTTHEWYQHLVNLKQFLNGEDAPKEPKPHDKTTITFLDDRTYLIQKGCWEIIEGEYCNGDLRCLNWKKDDPTPHHIFYVCEKCGNSIVR
jgi:hypothetical protein